MPNNTKRKDAGNFAWIAVGELIGRVFQFLYLKVLTGAIGTENFGIISFAGSNVSFFVLFATLGLDTYGIREIAKNRDSSSSIVNSILTLRLILAFLAYGILFSYISLSVESEFIRMIMLIIGLRIMAESLHFSWVFQGLENFKVSALRNTALYFFSFVGIYALVSTPDHTTLAVTILMVVMISVSLAQIIYYVLKIDSIKISINLDAWKKILKQSIPIGISAFFIIVYNNSDMIMIGFMRGNIETGLYSAAFKILTIAIIPSGLIQQIFYPKLSKFANPEDSLKILIKYIQILFSLAVFIAGSFYIYAKELILFQFHEEYLASVPALEIMTMKIFLSFAAVTFTTSLLASSKQNFVMKAVAFSALLNIILNFVLIPDFGFIGAAWTTVISEFFVVVSLAWMTIKICKENLLKHILKPMSVGIISVIISFLAFDFFGNVIISSLISIFVFGILVIFSQIISVQNLKETLANKKIE
jgi:O-antigen/teichoic acid export membrane protein